MLLRDFLFDGWCDINILIRGFHSLYIFSLLLCCLVFPCLSIILILFSITWFHLSRTIQVLWIHCANSYQASHRSYLIPFPSYMPCTIFQKYFLEDPLTQHNLCSRYRPRMVLGIHYSILRRTEHYCTYTEAQWSRFSPSLLLLHQMMLLHFQTFNGIFECRNSFI